VVRLLVDRDADVNAQGGFYGSALHAASWGGHEAVVRLLRDKGAVT
jgi:ankyrin repeat protein